MSELLTGLADLLAVPPAKQRAIKTTTDFEGYVVAGLPSIALRRVHQALGVTVVDLSPVLGISPRAFYSTLKRRRIDKPQSDRIYRVARVIAQATEVLGSRPKAIQWMHTPIAALGQATPFHKLSTEIGAARVNEVLTAIEHGVYA